MQAGYGETSARVRGNSLKKLDGSYVTTINLRDNFASKVRIRLGPGQNHKAVPGGYVVALESGTRLATNETEGGTMTTPGSYIDQNQQTLIPANSIMTEEKQHEVRCGVCARELYVDEDAYSYYTEALISGLDNPFRCEVCSEEYDDLVYEG